MGVKILSVGSYTPELVVTNDMLSNIVDTDDEWIQTRTGIKERRISRGETTATLASKASKIAIERSGLNINDIDLIINATVTPDYFMPSTACIVQSMIDNNKAVCFDISSACSGFVYALDIAKSMLETKRYKNALVIGAETMSKILDWNDRGTCVLFGDGAGAAVLTYSEEDSIPYIKLGSDGSKNHLLTNKAVPLNNPFIKEKENEDYYIKMNGKEIFKFAVNLISDEIIYLCEKNNISLSDIEMIIPHQANVRIISSAAEKLNISIDKFFMNIDRYGNTSGASIPIALDEMYNRNLLKKGKYYILIAFGAGLTWGSALIRF